MIKIAQFSDGSTGSVFIRRGRKGVHDVDVWTPKQTRQYQINRKDLEEGHRTKEDIMRAAVEIFEREVLAPKEQWRP